MANKLIATVSPGKTFTADEKVDNDKLNQLGLPDVDMTGSLVTNDTFEPGPFSYGAAGGTGDALTVTLNPAPASLAAGDVHPDPGHAGEYDGGDDRCQWTWREGDHEMGKHTIGGGGYPGGGDAGPAV
jgi:hypothetical protein